MTREQEPPKKRFPKQPKRKLTKPPQTGLGDGRKNERVWAVGYQGDAANLRFGKARREQRAAALTVWSTLTRHPDPQRFDSELDNVEAVLRVVGYLGFTQRLVHPDQVGTGQVPSRMTIALIADILYDDLSRDEVLALIRFAVTLSFNEARALSPNNPRLLDVLAGKPLVLPLDVDRYIVVAYGKGGYVLRRITNPRREPPYGLAGAIETATSFLYTRTDVTRVEIYHQIEEGTPVKTMVRRDIQL